MDKIAEQAEKMEKLRAACNEFKKFQELMRSRNRYDFDDMINWVIDAFKHNEDLLRTYQEQFQYILVDEYQDTSGSQNNLVNHLINYWDKPNVFVVGDDDQSIYRFQGANVENMLTFATTYEKDLLKVVLVNNYRSTQPILDISKTLIDNNEERLVKKIEGLSKELIASNAALTSGLAHPPSVLEYERQQDEMIGTVLQQHPDLCAVIGNWDGMMIGAAAAVEQAGKAGTVGVYTTDSSAPTCEAIKKGSMTAALNYSVPDMGSQMVAIAKYLLQSGVEPGSGKTAIFSRMSIIDQSNVADPEACYDGKVV